MIYKGDVFVKISPRFAGILTSFIVAFGMSFVMSFVMVVVNLGFSEEFLMSWLRAWITGLSVGFPTAAIVVPFARRVIMDLTSDPKLNA